MIERDGEVVIIGDIHGQFYDMISMLDENIEKLKSNKDFGFLFLGDYVDRGI